jgi:two-component system phosphate regulon sensor histidine kinase PhoR
MMLGRDLRILRANKAAEALFGKNIQNTTFNTVVNDPALEELIVAVMGNKQCEDMEISITNHNIKHDFQISIERFPLFSIGGIAVVIIMHDVTAAKKTRQMLKDFVANASHEIRTPLTSISGFIENLREMEEDKETRKKFLDIMFQQSERMGILVNDLLSLSKVEMNESTLPTEKIDILPLIESTVGRLEHLAASKQMNIVYNCDDKLPEILGDTNEISQVFTNLISNSIKYGYENTPIIVTALLLSDNHPLRTAHKVIAVSVADKGEGIPAEHLSRITERFYRVDKVRSHNIGGTGLGLSIVKHITNRHRGMLNIESSEGVGSIFTVYFPVCEQ